VFTLVGVGETVQGC